MKLLKIIGHPVVVVSLFLLILISGEQFGGFYLLYIIMGLPYGAPHAIISLIGLITIVIGLNASGSKPHILKPVLNVIGIMIMVLGLVIFFNRSQGYNNSTFFQIVPLVSLSLFGISALCSIIQSVWMIVKTGSNKQNGLGIVS